MKTLKHNRTHGTDFFDILELGANPLWHRSELEHHKNNVITRSSERWCFQRGRPKQVPDSLADIQKSEVLNESK